MTFVITQRCCNDASCVAVCPVQCIRPRPGDHDFTSSEQLYIDPTTCIDCGACATACPVDAIYPASQLPPGSEKLEALNAAHFSERPLDVVQAQPIRRHRLPPSHPGVKVAIIGSGPAGLYAAAELTEVRDVSVTVIERLPTPFGLIRSGVAPDHDATKKIEEHFTRVLMRPNLRCLFNVEVGRDLSLEELLETHHAVLWATGVGDGTKVRCPGADLPGSVTSHEFVSWYNGHPDFAEHHFDLTGRRAVIIGNGNVALDIARVLTRPIEQLASTTMSDIALERLQHSQVEEVVIAARRAEPFAAYAIGELIGLSHLPGVALRARAGEISTAGEEENAGVQRSAGDRARRRALVMAAASNSAAAPRSIVLRYGVRPVAITGKGAVAGVEFELRSGQREHMTASVVIHATGFVARPVVPGVPFDRVKGALPHREGRVVDPATGEPVAGLYCAGWLKRGATGVIGTNRSDASETVSTLLGDLHRGVLTDPVGDVEALADLLAGRTQVVSKADWLHLDTLERSAGRLGGRPRAKLVRWPDLLNALPERS